MLRRAIPYKDEGLHPFVLLSFLLVSLFLYSRVDLLSAALTAAQHSEPLPSELKAPLSEQLKAGGLRASVDGNTLDFWWSTGIPLTGTGSAAWSFVPEGALVGAVKIAGAFRDIRGRVIKPGVYTLRYGLQPENGDHLGVSPYRQFLLISPAADDSDPGPQGHDGTVELAKGSIGGSHPGVWSIDPPAAAASQPLLSIHKTDLGHQAVIVEVPAARDGKPAGSLKFGIVLVGKIEA
jgi:hypothetical protein